MDPTTFVDVPAQRDEERTQRILPKLRLVRRYVSRCSANFSTSAQISGAAAISRDTVKSLFLAITQFTPDPIPPPPRPSFSSLPVPRSPPKPRGQKLCGHQYTSMLRCIHAALQRSFLGNLIKKPQRSALSFQPDRARADSRRPALPVRAAGSRLAALDLQPGEPTWNVTSSEKQGAFCEALSSSKKQAPFAFEDATASEKQGRFSSHRRNVRTVAVPPSFVADL